MRSVKQRQTKARKIESNWIYIQKIFRREHSQGKWFDNIRFKLTRERDIRMRLLRFRIVTWRSFFHTEKRFTRQWMQIKRQNSMKARKITRKNKSNNRWNLLLHQHRSRTCIICFIVMRNFTQPFLPHLNKESVEWRFRGKENQNHLKKP